LLDEIFNMARKKKLIINKKKKPMKKGVADTLKEAIGTVTF
jgi:hypothetical protein